MSSIFDPTDQASVERKIAMGIERIAQALKSLIWQVSTASGLSPIQIQFLTLLLHTAEGKVTIGFLASHFALTSATVSDAVTALERKGLIARERKKEDKRTVYVSLTRKGKGSARKLSGWANLLEEKVSRLSGEQKTVLLQSVVSIIQGLQDEGVVSLTKMCVTCRFFQPSSHFESSKESGGQHRCSHFNRVLANVDIRIDCAAHEATVPS